MTGLIAALIAVYLGAAGPRFRWQGAGLLGLAAVVAGMIETARVAHEAAVMGLHYGITLSSFATGLLLQIAFMLTFYVLAAICRWSARSLTAHRMEAAPPTDGAGPVL